MAKGVVGPGLYEKEWSARACTKRLKEMGRSRLGGSLLDKSVELATTSS
jgi:hypothetical protein